MTRQTLCGSILGDTKVAAPPENRSTGFSCGRFFLACSKTKNFCRLRRQTALRVPRDTKTQRRTSDPQRDQPQLQTTQPHPDNQERSINYTAEQILLTTRPTKRGTATEHGARLRERPQRGEERVEPAARARLIEPSETLQNPLFDAAVDPHVLHHEQIAAIAIILGANKHWL